VTSRPRSLSDSTGALARWFSSNARDLPWRTDRSPYRVWLSEIMLQQTQVSVVVDYFDRFTKRFPTVADLARADVDDVLALWSGLGYYARGRNLHRAARAVVDEHGGAFPETTSGLTSLPGVGPYTAAAVVAFAFGGESVLVDGNVARVVSRLFDVDVPVDGAEGRARVHAHARALVDAAEQKPLHNEAMMELGATVCTPARPACSACPLEKHCRARARGVVDDRPMKKPKRARAAISLLAVVVDDGERIVLERRADRGLFGGTFAPPCVVADDDEGPRAQLTGLLTDMALTPRRAHPRRLPAPVVVERSLTHRALTFSVHHVTRPLEEARAPFVVVPLTALAELGMSSAARAVLSAAIPDIDRFFGAARRRR